MNNKLKKISVVLSVLLVTVSFVIDGGDVSSKSLEKSEVLSGRSSDKTELADLTVRIASLLERRKAKNLPENVHLGDDFAELAERRFGKLSALIETDTAEVLRSALPEDVLAKIPAEYQDYFEKRGQIKGELEVIAECDENDGRNLFYLNTEKERFELYFAVKAERELLTGANITVKGVRVGNAFAVGEDSLQIDRDNSQSAELEILSNTTGEQKLLVLLVNFQNNTSQPYTIDQVNNLIFNHSNSSSVTNFYIRTDVACGRYPRLVHAEYDRRMRLRAHRFKRQKRGAKRRNKFIGLQSFYVYLSGFGLRLQRSRNARRQ
jgi:hypothetical protein